MAKNRSKTGGTTGTNQHGVKGKSQRRDGAGGSRTSAKKLAKGGLGSMKRTAISNKGLFSSSHRRESTTLYVSQGLISNGHFGMMPDHPRFEKTLEKLGGKLEHEVYEDSEIPMRRYDGSQADFKAELLREVAGSGAVFDAEKLAGGKGSLDASKDLSKDLVEEGDPVDAPRKLSVKQQRADRRRGVRAAKPEPRSITHIVEHDSKKSGRAGRFGLDADLVSELVGGDIVVLRPKGSPAERPFRFVDSTSGKVVGFAMGVRMTSGY